MPKTLKKGKTSLKKSKPPKTVHKKSDLKVVEIVKKAQEEKKKVNVVKIDYIFTIGRRKSSIARIRYYKKGGGEIIINGLNFNKYFKYFEFQKILFEPLKLTNRIGQGKFSIKVDGGGLRGQAESIRLGISRILLKLDNKLKPVLKSKKLLTRDPRVKERKKYGLRKARRAPQWQKR